MKLAPITFATLALVSGTATADAPQPGQLSTIMATLSGDMNQIQVGLWAGDLARVSEAASAIAHHPGISDVERQRIMDLMGDDMVRFKEADEVVHQAATKLSEVAARGDTSASLAALVTLQTGCVSCHTSFRARLKD